ncbi:hypothetical protein LAUMK35_01335 [Mycobacterium pseudokansasii]|nr:hypothetical protein LAUMK35_01335 [Mycobacterium pseudokansasii]VAZ91506.1 hypothetical protein LAUMK21_01335 [Mycobacterium pseudokansasii]
MSPSKVSAEESAARPVTHLSELLRAPILARGS